jgi:hypothetical protein
LLRERLEFFFNALYLNYILFCTLHMKSFFNTYVVIYSNNVIIIMIIQVHVWHVECLTLCTFILIYIYIYICIQAVYIHTYINIYISSYRYIYDMSSAWRFVFRLYIYIHILIYIYISSYRYIYDMSSAFRFVFRLYIYIHILIYIYHYIGTYMTCRVPVALFSGCIYTYIY